MCSSDLFGARKSSRDLKSILFTPNSLVDFDFLQGVVCFSSAFCAEVLLVFHGGEMGVPGLMDYNIKEIEEQYRNSNMPQ